MRWLSQLKVVIFPLLVNARTLHSVQEYIEILCPCWSEFQTFSFSLTQHVPIYISFPFQSNSPVADRLSKSQQTLSWTVLLEIIPLFSFDIGDQNPTSLKAY